MLKRILKYKIKGSINNIKPWKKKKIINKRRLANIAYRTSRIVKRKINN